MSLNRFAKRRDDSEKEIVAALQRCGALVFRLDRPADLLVWHRQSWHVIEVKNRRRNDQPKQDLFRKLTGTPVVANADEAMRAVGAIR